MATEVRPADWPAGSGYAHGISAEGRVVCVAGQIGWDARSQVVVDGGLVAQTRRALENIVAVLDAAGARPEHLVRLTWFITDRDAYVQDRKTIGTMYREVIGRHFPPMSVIVVAGLLEPGAMVEIEATAVVPSDTRVNSTGA